MKVVGNKIYDVCGQCAKIIQTNKFIFGSTHICVTEEEYKRHRLEIMRKYKENVERLKQLY